MPTRTKTWMFFAGFLTSLGASAIICSILGTSEWITSTISIQDNISQGTVIITYGLLRGQSFPQLSHGLEEPMKYFEVLGTLKASSQKSLQVVAVLFVVFSLCASLLSCGFTFYNSVSNPYQTFLGPVGVYTWNGLSACFIFVAMMLFVGNTQSYHLSQELSQVLHPDFTPKGATHSYGYSFWLILLVILLNAVTVVIIVFYQRARYQQKQEQKKPMEYAPRDGILF
ncbi:clarin-3 [Ochotona curzoniae]|uniref:clarin-3 n=1 Tax=Ochotona curzoniae TaxID=130825 RepID=UPI001B34B114|nr:clarin-3 [Ochotona curzoniae]